MNLKKWSKRKTRKVGTGRAHGRGRVIKGGGYHAFDTGKLGGSAPKEKRRVHTDELGVETASHWEKKGKTNRGHADCRPTTGRKAKTKGADPRWLEGGKFRKKSGGRPLHNKRSSSP